LTPPPAAGRSAANITLIPTFHRNPMIRSALMTVMTGAAIKAGRGLKRDFGEIGNLQVSMKGPGDFVSLADQRAEKIIFEELSKARPGYGFVMEEGGVVEGSDKSHVWHIDPLDATTNLRSRSSPFRSRWSAKARSSPAASTIPPMTRCM
jgi:hypothetical protein